MACGHKGREFYANDPEKLARYDMAMRHIEAAREEVLRKAIDDIIAEIEV